MRGVGLKILITLALKRNNRLFTHFINYRTGTKHGKYRFHWNKDKTWWILPPCNPFHVSSKIGFCASCWNIQTKVRFCLFLFLFKFKQFAYIYIYIPIDFERARDFLKICLAFVTESKTNFRWKQKKPSIVHVKSTRFVEQNVLCSSHYLHQLGPIWNLMQWCSKTSDRLLSFCHTKSYETYASLYLAANFCFILTGSSSSSSGDAGST